MIKKIKQLYNILKSEIIRVKVDNCFYKCSLSTSCAIPNYKQEKPIWLISVFCFDTFEIEYYWIESEEELAEYLKLLNLNCLTYEVKQYCINK
jgi:hypothetical protein